MKNIRLYSTIIVGLHLAIALYHAVVHVSVNVGLPLLESLYVLAAVYVGPPLGLGLLYTRWQKTGAIILTVTMLGAFFFGWAYHFLIDGADNVSHITGAWQMQFLVTSVLLFVFQALGSLIGVWAMITTFRSPAVKPA